MGGIFYSYMHGYGCTVKPHECMMYLHARNIYNMYYVIMHVCVHA